MNSRSPKDGSAQPSPKTQQLTKTQVEKLKNAAKDLCRQTGIPHMKALDLVCQKEGLGSWTEAHAKLVSQDVSDPKKGNPAPENLDCKDITFEQNRMAWYQEFGKKVELIEPHGDFFRILRIESAFFGLLVHYDDVHVARLDPKKAHQKTPRIIDSVPVTLAEINVPTGKRLYPGSYDSRWPGYPSVGDLWICKYGPQEPRIWLGDIPEPFGLLTINYELGIGLGRECFVSNQPQRQEAPYLTYYSKYRPRKSVFERSNAYPELIQWAKKYPKRAKNIVMSGPHPENSWYSIAKHRGDL